MTLKWTKFVLGVGICSAAWASPHGVFYGTDSGKLAGVKLYSSAQIQDGSSAIPLTRFGAGLREKKVVFIWAKVYVAQMYSSFELKKVPEQVQDLVTKLPIAIALSFVRTVDAGKISTAFLESFEANQVAVSRPPYSSFLEQLKTMGEVKEGQTLWLILQNVGEKEQVTVERDGREILQVTGDKKDRLIFSMLSIWLGVPADSGLEKLKRQIFEQVR